MKITVTNTLIFTTLAATTLVSAKGEPLYAPKTGLYVGAALGGADLTTKSNFLLNRLAAGAVPASQNFFLNTTEKNIAADIFVGYGKHINRFSLEGEFIGSVAPLKSTSTLGLSIDNSQSLEIKTTSAAGGAFNLGYHINTTTKLYLKIGFEVRKFKVIFSDPSNVYLNLNKNYNSTAFVPGLGLEIGLTPSLSLRTEYRVALHPKKTVQVSNSASQATSIETKPTIHYLNLGLVFKI